MLELPLVEVINQACEYLVDGASRRVDWVVLGESGIWLRSSTEIWLGGDGGKVVSGDGVGWGACTGVWVGGGGSSTN